MIISLRSLSKRHKPKHDMRQIMESYVRLETLPEASIEFLRDIFGFQFFKEISVPNCA